MAVVGSIRSRFGKEQPFRDLTIGASLHVTAETANLLASLRDGGAKVFVCASNPLSTQDDVAAALAEEPQITVFARRGEGRAKRLAALDAVIGAAPQLTLDDGCDLVGRLHEHRRAGLGAVLGGTEQTTTGVLQLRSMAAAGALCYPVVAVDDAETKRLFDNCHGTGQSTLDGIMRATNILLAGKHVVVAGYGRCGKGVAERARGLGALVTVTEVHPMRALEAITDGFAVEPMMVAARHGELFVTVTGNKAVLRREHFEVMLDGAILANSGHFDIEIDLAALAQMARGKHGPVRELVEQYTVPAGGQAGTKRLLVLAEGRLVNLALADGNPASVMDLSFANQALALEWIVAHHHELTAQVYPIPPEIDGQIARLKVAAMGVSLDELTEDQRRYLASWTPGPDSDLG